MSEMLPRARIVSDPYGLLATWFGVGLSPKAPGTVGSAAALPYAALIHYFLGSHMLLLMAAVLFFIGVRISDLYMERFSRTGDPSEVVIDEVAGMFLALSFLDLSVQGYLFGFVVFRLFDIFKPWPIGWADRKLTGGVGVMVDDVLAALATVIVWLFLHSLGLLAFV